MTDVLTDIKDIMEMEERQNNYHNSKVNIIFDFLKLKIIAKKSKEKIKKYTEKTKKIRDGKTVLAGTRITTKELILIMAENKKEENICEYISKQYPSINSQEKILYGALYEIKKMNSIIFILGVLFDKV